MRGFGAVVRLAIHVTSHHTLDTLPQADMAYGFDEDIHVFGDISDLIRFGLQSWFSFYETFRYVAI